MLLLYVVAAFSQQKLPIIKATSPFVDIRDGEYFEKGNWRIAPEVKPDVYSTYVTRKGKRVTFYTDLDSISFDVKPNKSYNFIILFNQDSAYTQISARKDAGDVKFSDRYIKQYKGKYSIEVPEFQELVHIIIALTPTGLVDSNMVEHRTAYYQEILSHFGKYKTEPIVQKVDQLVQNGYYAHLKMDACGFYFKGDKVKKDIYNRLNWSAENFVIPLLQEFIDFSAKTGFRKFYAAHKPYYDSLIALMNVQTPVKKQWDWLENEFPNKYDNYRITFSPLVNGSHSTNHFNDNNFSQTVMFICGPIEHSKYNKNVVEGLMTRVVFTEIDHNYVNYISDQYLNRIDAIFNNREKWTTKGVSADAYNSPYLVFNEYMTWAVFSMYAYDHFTKEDFEIINARVELQMTEWRGFSKFKEFNQKALELYKSKKNTEKIPDLYPKLLAWCEKE